MRVLPVLLLAYLLAAVPGPAAAGEAPLPDPTAMPGPIRYRPHALVIRLRDAAASRARATPVAARPAVTRVERLGIGALDRLAAGLGGVWFEPEFPGERAPAALGLDGARSGLDGFYIAHLPPATDRDRALAAFRALPEVAAADPIAIVPVQAIPDDSLWTSAYYFSQPSGFDMSAVPAWDLCRGDSTISVGVMDTGVLLHHPDLHDRIRINWPERDGIPGVDDDGNGYVDDDRGWDFVALDSASLVVRGEDWRDEDNDPDDFVAHGTAVAGLVAARTNNHIGISSVAWDARILPLRVGWSAARAPSGEIDLSYVAQAMVYATRLGTQVLNCSFTSVVQSDLVAAADFATRSGVTIVAAAGNGQPAHYLPDRDDVIAVAATDRLDQVAPFSNRGGYVDVAAAGVTVATTSITRPGTDSLGYRQPSYSTTASGTSFAAPLVAGAVALVQSYRVQQGLPLLHPIEAQLRLVESADDISAQNPGVTGYGSGRVNLLRALTDPPRSFLLPATSHTVGAGVAYRTYSGAVRMVFALADGRLVIADAASGATPLTVPLPGTPIAGIAAADLGRGRGTGLFVAVDAGALDGFLVAGVDPLGRPLPGCPATASGRRGDTAPALGDLDGDGALEVVCGAGDGRVWAWRSDGRLMPGFPLTLGGPYQPVRIALSDLDGTPGVEIVAVVSGGSVYALRGDGRSLAGWPVATFPASHEPVVMRLGTRPEPVVVVNADGNRVMALRKDGHTLWLRTPTGIEAVPMVAGDVDGDGFDEIVLARDVPSQIVVLDTLGAVRKSWEVAGFVSDPLPSTPLVASLALGGRPGILLFPPSRQLQLYDGGGVRLSRFPLPGRAGAAPSVVEIDDDGRSEVIAGSGADSSLYVYDAGPATWNASTGGWPTDRGNFARTGSRLYAPALAWFDDVPPAGIADLAAVAGPHGVELHWSAPADIGATGNASRYDLRFATRPLDEATFPLAEAVPGLTTPGKPEASEQAEVSGLDESTPYYFAIRAIDAAGNAGPITGLAIATLAARPDPVRDLGVIAWTDTSLTLRWRATGDDGSIGRPARYRIAAAPQPLDEAGFDAAPIHLDLNASGDAGAFESATLGGLERGRRYWLAVRAEDERGNRSTVSVALSAWVGPLAARSGIALASGAQPSRAPVELFWQEPGGAGVASRGIGIYDLGGRQVRWFALGPGTEGIERWDGRDRSGNRLPAGVYFARFVSGGDQARTRIVLIR